MVFLALIVLVAGIGLLTARAARRRGHRPSTSAATILRVSALIALARLGLFWAALALYAAHADWRQVAGYALLIVNSVVEHAIAAWWLGGPSPPLLVAGLIVLTSAVLGLGWTFIRFRPPSRVSDREDR